MWDVRYEILDFGFSSEGVSDKKLTPVLSVLAVDLGCMIWHGGV